LLARGDALLGSGDVVSARLCYERAAEGGDAQAALRLGETYDPAFLAGVHLNGIRGDATAAMRWYQYALTLGATEAQTLLTAVAANDDAVKRSKEMNQLFEQFLARGDGQTH
jgi:TPR repeat protein